MYFATDYKMLFSIFFVVLLITAHSIAVRSFNKSFTRKHSL